MGNFYFDGKNTILETLISKLPDGKIYNKDNNIIPFINELTFVEFYNSFPDGTKVDIYIDGKLVNTKKILTDKSIYCKLKPPYGKFRLQTYINNNLITDEYFISINIFVFFVILAKELNYDYIELFKMFSNLYYDSLQQNLIYKKWGWFFDLPQGSFTTTEYRQIIVGDPVNYLGTVRSFMNAAVEEGIIELVKSFTTVEPILFSYREFDGWILRDLNIYPKTTEGNMIWHNRFADYWLGEIPINMQNKRIILMSKKFKLNAFIIYIQNWSFGEEKKEILNKLIYKIIPAQTKVEIIYSS
jgi:hypothetical protein